MTLTLRADPTRETMSPFVQWVIGAIIWALANVVYVDMKRKGVGGFRRIVAFWLGNPTTWFSFFLVREGRMPRFEPPPDDDQALLMEIRMDRERRGLSGPDEPEHEIGQGRAAPPKD